MAIEMREAGATEWTELAVKDAAGQEVDELYIDNTLVWQAETPIDIFDRTDLGYDIGDEGQATLPQIVENEGYDNPNALWCPSGNTNDATNLSPNNPSYDSTRQIDLDEYLTAGEIAEFYLRPETWTSTPQFRVGIFTDGYYPGQDHIRIRWTDGYVRLEQGSNYYTGGGSSESYTGFNTIGNWHRYVVDASAFPEIYVHMWDATTGEWIDTIGGNGDGNPDNEGHYVWYNDGVEAYLSDFRLIDANDFTAGEPL